MRVLRWIRGSRVPLHVALAGALAVPLVVIAAPAGAQAPPAVPEAARAGVLVDEWFGDWGRGDTRGRDRDGRRDDRRPLFTWSGTVDREVTLLMRGRDVWVRGDDAFGRRDRPRIEQSLPRARGEVRVRVHDGRGTVQVVEQPSARNDWTAAIRIRDPRSGADRYRIATWWEGDARDWDPRDGRWPGDRGRDDDDWPRGGRDDDRGRGGRGDAGALRWSGRVDDIVDLRIQGRRVETVTRSGDRTRDVSSRIDGAALPARATTVRVVRADGRGTVTVVQQPNASNGYTAIVRIRDPRSGAATYDIDVQW